MITPLRNDPHPQASLFQILLRDIVNPDHPLVLLTHAIDWEALETMFVDCYCQDNGRPACPIRVMVGLQYLRAIEGISDDDILAHWCENPYWQYFTGGTYFEHEPPTDQATMSRWRKRISEKGVEALFHEIIKTGLRTKAIKPAELKHVNVDTTVQPNNIRFPTDARLYDRARERLVKQARKEGITLERSYVRKSKQLLRRQGNYAHAKQFKRAQKMTNKIKGFLLNVVDDIAAAPTCSPHMAGLLLLARRLLAQKRDDKNKLYSIHEPQTECIAKGKAHKPYEFGVKTGLVSTAKAGWVVGVQTFPGNPYDGHTLDAMLAQSERFCGVSHTMAACDLGYRGHTYTGPCDIQVVKRSRRGLARGLLRWWKRRSAIEPVIGHMKREHGLGCNMLHGELGEKQNAFFAAIGFNLMKLLRALACFFVFILSFRHPRRDTLARLMRGIGQVVACIFMPHASGFACQGMQENDKWGFA